MVNFISWVFSSFFDLFDFLTYETVMFISNIVGETNGMPLETYDINLVLFSETPILSTNLYEFLGIFFSIFYTVIFVVIAWKIIKKVVVKITRWNKW